MLRYEQKFILWNVSGYLSILFPDFYFSLGSNYDIDITQKSCTMVSSQEGEQDPGRIY